jgi:hypothetical protein
LNWPKNGLKECRIRLINVTNEKVEADIATALIDNDAEDSFDESDSDDDNALLRINM